MPDENDDDLEVEEIETLDDALAELEKRDARIAELESANNPGVWPMIIALDPPLEFGKKSPPITQLRVRQPRMGDLLGIPVNPQQWMFDHILDVAQALTTVGDSKMCISKHALRKLPPEQGSLITTTVRVFFLKCL